MAIITPGAPRETAGSIAAGAVGADQIADGTIEAVELGSTLSGTISGKYVKPAGGIPLTDLGTDVAAQIGWLAPTDGADEVRDRIAASSAGDMVVLPDGEFETSEPVVFRPDRKYWARNTTIKQAAGANLPGIFVPYGWSQNEVYSGAPVTIEGLTVDGNKANNPTAGHGIILMNYYSQIIECTVSDTKGSGIVISNANSAGTQLSNTAVENKIVGCRVYSPDTHGIWVTDVSSQGACTDGYIVECLVGFSLDAAIRVDRGAGWQIAKNHTYGSGRGIAKLSSYATVAGAGGINVDNSWATWITDNYIDGFGAVTDGGTHVGINVNKALTGPPCTVTGNNVTCTERALATYLYYRIKNASGSDSTTTILSGNTAHALVVAGAASNWLSIQPNSGTITLREVLNVVSGTSSTATTGAGTITRTGPGSVTTKGDLLVASGVGTVARLAVGTDQKFLRADSTATLGVAWDTYAGADFGGRPSAAIQTFSSYYLDTSASSPQPSAGTMYLTYFTPDITLLVSNMTTWSRGTAGVGTTLAKMALFSVDGSGNLTCIARTDNHSTMWSAGSTAYTKAVYDDGAASPNLVANITLTRGQRYAFGPLHVGSSTAPTLAGKADALTIRHGALTGMTRIQGYVTGLSDIPATISAATISGNTASSAIVYAILN